MTGTWLGIASRKKCKVIFFGFQRIQDQAQMESIIQDLLILMEAEITAEFYVCP